MIRHDIQLTSTKGTMDPEGARLRTYSVIVPTVSPGSRLCIKYSSLRSSAHHAGVPLRWTLGYTQCGGSDGSMSSFKSIT